MSAARSVSDRMDGLRPVDQAVVLADPGVVFVDTAVSIAIQVTDQEAAQAVGIPTLEGHFDLTSFSSGSGTVVAPDCIVTARHVDGPDEQQRRKIIGYATNRLFLQSDAGRSLAENADLFEQHRTGDPAVDELLRRCYDEVACRLQIEPTVTVFTPAQIAGGSTTEGLPAQVLRHLGPDNTDVAVLQVDAGNLPTVPLAISTAHMEARDVVTALGYPRSVRELPAGLIEPTKLVGRINAVRSDSASRVIEVDMRVESGMSGGPALDLSGRVVGLLAAGHQAAERQQARLLPVEDIRSALRWVKVEASRGEIDQLFEQAMDYFWNCHYGAAMRLYRQVLALQPGHPLAKWYLAQAEARAGGTEDVPLPRTTAGNALVARLVRLLGLVAGVVIAIAVIRRRRLARRD
jgi:hypothetical protein